MAKRVYKTAGGKSIDFDTMQLKGEETIAVGNMGVNARGDKLGKGGEVVKKREEVIADYYRIHNGTIPEDRPVPDPDDIDDANVQPAHQDPILTEVESESPNSTKANNETISSDELATALASTAEVVKTKKVEPVEKPIVKTVEDEQTEAEHKTYENEVEKSSDPEVEEPKVETKPTTRGGLASAVKKVQTAKPVVKEKTAQQEVKEKGGVKRL